ncbi:uncharacterized protein [Amphiura filiformis]|uniref:uncharacterized protein n=1 Tax=Amphiura filiformis TaxID=82378 RepID=UPI003B21752B
MVGKAREAQNRILTPGYDYETLKTTILKAFQLTPEAYRKKFRNIRKLETESVTAYIQKLTHNFECWVKYSDVKSDDAESIINLMIREQIMERIPADMRKYLLDKGIKDVEEMAKEAEEYASHRENYWKQNPSCQYKQGSKEPRKFAPNQQSRAQPYQKPNVNGSVSNGVYNTGKNDNQRQHQTVVKQISTETKNIKIDKRLHAQAQEMPQADILMRKWVPSRKQKRQVDEQIIVPKQYRQQLIEIAHDKAGHMGIRKTTDRITAHFFWPGIFAEVRKYCQNCSECQYKSMVKNRQFLQPMPIIDTPFKRVGIDIVGPLPVTEKGNRCMLTVCDYATRYPEAIPLPDQKASTVANALITVFSRVGLPSEIIHDQGTNFMSHVVKDMCSRLGIQQIPTTPYHQQMNGMTERFHETLKLMIKSLTEEQKVNWDDQIPLFLFSYREVPCEATGYSPFHLLYGREIRGPLSLIKEGWLEQTKEPQNVAEHLLEMSANLTKWMASARANKEISQKKMKYYYDKHAQDRTYQVGEEVLVFLPEGAGKLDSKSQGPYKISKKIGDANYEIIMPDKRKSKRVLHANQKKKWYSREHTDYIYNCYCVTGVVQEIGVGTLSEEEDNELETQFLEDNIGPTYTQTQTWKDTTICESVSQIQKKEMSTVLKAHSKAFSDVPGRTNVISHTVKTTSEVPIRQRAYRTPHALKQKVKEELDGMLRLGVIEPTTSAYASPIVVVAKPNGDIRLCTDYRALNKITEFDPYCMPRIDQILDEVAKGKYISTLDLTKGFYQVPLDEQAKAKSAFVTPFGQFQYNVMPFGMQNSSATFQKLVDTVLQDCSEFCKQYIDDICIYSNTWEEHLEHLDVVLGKIQNAGLTIKPAKSKIAFQQVTYLGHKVGNEQIEPTVDKLESVEKFPTPITKKNVRAFLGLTGYYRKFVQVC